MIYIQPLSQYKFNLKSTKITGLARLARNQIPTVSNLFIIKPRLFKEFLKTKKLPTIAQKELKKIFLSIRKSGETITLRNSVWEKGNPGIAYTISNTINIKKYSYFEERIVSGYEKVHQAAFNPHSVEFSYLIYPFYSSEKCGLLITRTKKNQMLLQAVFGQHTQVLLRDNITPDTYTINKNPLKIVTKSTAKKLFKIKKTDKGVKKVKIREKDQALPVISDKQALTIAKLGKLLEKKFGPQEIEWAILDDGKIIFQETKDLKIKKEFYLAQKSKIINPSEVQAKVISLEKLPVKTSLKNKIVITSNLNIAFINSLAFVHRPKAVILTRGSLTSHAATILRESKIPTLFAKRVFFQDNQTIKIKKNGAIKVIS